MAVRIFLTPKVDADASYEWRFKAQLRPCSLAAGRARTGATFVANTVKVRSTCNTSYLLTFHFRQRGEKRAGPLKVNKVPFLDTTFSRDSVRNDET